MIVTAVMAVTALEVVPMILMIIIIMVVTATNQQEISSNTIEEGQGTIPGAVTAVTAVTSAVSENNTIDTQVSLPPTTALQQTRSETKQNAGDIYMSGANWYCRHCKLSGDKFYMQVHICKGYILYDMPTSTSANDFFFK